ncbi:unnamed protein product [Callosobruchus maculatus]|uniref:Secreted protein n=1 Tax=Callosobruchus maculatus TaxID=64391 RepID=A0A653DCL2_CALMS|nr:unnamed protein product [Callosobruchus maculatus]
MRVICILALVFVAVCDAEETYNDYGVERFLPDDDETFNDYGVERSLGGTPEDDETFNDYGVERSLGGTPDDDETFNDYGVERTFAPGDYGENRDAEPLGKKHHHHHHHHHHVTKCPVEKNSEQGEANRDDGPILWPHLTKFKRQSKSERGNLNIE